MAEEVVMRSVILHLRHAPKTALQLVNIPRIMNNHSPFRHPAAMPHEISHKTRSATCQVPKVAVGDMRQQYTTGAYSNTSEGSRL
jgi:hypothetical protein